MTLANEKDDILAHASFFDHPVGDLVDQTHWERFMQKHFSAEKCTVCISLKFFLQRAAAVELFFIIQDHINLWF